MKFQTICFQTAESLQDTYRYCFRITAPLVEFKISFFKTFTLHFCVESYIRPEFVQTKVFDLWGFFSSVCSVVGLGKESLYHGKSGEVVLVG